MRRFEALLAKNALTRAEASNRAFDCLSFCPPSGELRERWELIRRSRPRPNAPAEPRAQALLLSYHPEFGGSLWLLEARAASPGDAELGTRARHELERATMLVSRELPTLVEVPRDRDAWSISRIATGGEGVLDGPSFGLSMCLAAAAHCLGLPSPPNIVATAAVDSDGALSEVGGLAEKLRALDQWALGVDTVIVAETQSSTARSIVQTLGATWHIVGARTVTEAVATCFPNLWRDLESRWSDETTSARVASDLLRLARDGSNHVLSWRGIAEAAARLTGALRVDSRSWKDARFAELIARRHEGQEALLSLDAEHLAGMRRPLRLRCLAHVVQSHADWAEDFFPELERAVEKLLPREPADDSPDDLRVLGALGRWLAAFVRYDPAKEALERAVRGWFELDCVPEASHALSELLRVTAVTNAHEAFGRCVHDYAEPFLGDPRSAAVSRAFVLYALGRGRALLGDFSDARRRLSDDACEWALVPDHLRALRLRWLWKAAHSTADIAAADRATRELAGLIDRAPHLEYVRMLAELDAALGVRRGEHEVLQRLARARPVEYRRFERTYGEDVAGRIVREYPY